MPRYDYHCPANDRTVEVEHAMSDQVATWGELCDRAGLDPGKTPRTAPVEKLLSLPFVGKSAAPVSDCGMGSACCRGACKH
ncbi:MAG: hypothetical protein KJZ65_08560 [Phycisphaerales bacterium]|nr:hypothetical protein [Phycisphaerales bacterium]